MPTTAYTDNFNRASLGTNWSIGAGGSAAISGSTVLRLSWGGGSSPGIAYTNTNAHAALADVRATVKRVTGATFDGSVLVRKQAGDSYYYLDVVDGTTTHNVYRRVTGADTSIATRTFTSGAGDLLGLEATGTGATVILRVYLNGVQQGADIADTSGSRITGAGFAGCVSWALNLDFDDFTVEDLSAGGGGGGGGPFPFFLDDAGLSGGMQTLGTFSRRGGGGGLWLPDRRLALPGRRAA